MKRGKGVCPKCEVCQGTKKIWTVKSRRGKTIAIEHAMHRLYIKKRGTWERVGWICLNCGSVIIDNPEISSGFEDFSSKYRRIIITDSFFSASD